MGEKFPIPKPLPEGFRPISVVLDAGLRPGPIKVEGAIPGGELYPSEIKRLSRKVLRNYGYGPAAWNDEAATVLKTREATEFAVMPWLKASASITLREVHDATLPPDISLRELQLVTRNDFGQEIDGQRILPTEYISYNLGTDTLQRWRIDNYYESMDPVAMQAQVEATRVAGEDRERLILYSRLLFLAGE